MRKRAQPAPRTTWILVCDASRARLFSSNEGKNGMEWSLLEELDHPESRAKGEEINTDKPGRVQQIGPGGMRAGMEPSTPPKEVEADRFAHHLSERLDKARTQNSYDRLILVAAPSFLGLMRGILSGPVKKTISASVAKDYTHTDERELQERLAEHLSS